MRRVILSVVRTPQSGVLTKSKDPYTINALLNTELAAAKRRAIQRENTSMLCLAVQME
jgi:hypothetical protein